MVMNALAYGKSYFGVKARPPSFDFWAEFAVGAHKCRHKWMVLNALAYGKSYIGVKARLPSFAN
jgi:hypothetical protein